MLKNLIFVIFILALIGCNNPNESANQPFSQTIDTGNPSTIHGFSRDADIIGTYSKKAQFVDASHSDFGVDATDRTDDSIALQAAIDYAKTKSTKIEKNKIQQVTGTVRLPPGVITLTSGIKVHSGVRMIGAGISSTTINFTGKSGNAIKIDKDSTEELYGVQFEDFALINSSGRGSPRGISGDDGNALAIRACNINNVLVYGFDINVYLNDSWTFHIENSIFQNAITANAILKNLTAGGAFNTRFDVSGGNSVELYEGTTGNSVAVVTFDKCTFQYADKWGLFGEDIMSLQVKNCFFESNNQNAHSNYGGIYLKNGRNNRGVLYEITGSHFISADGNPGQTAIKIDRAKFVELRNTISGSGIATGVNLGNDVDICMDKNTYDGQATRVAYTDTTTKLIKINSANNIPSFETDGVETSLFSASQASALFGKYNSGNVILGAFNNIGGMQGGGTGSDYKLKINPYKGDVEIALATNYQAYIGGTRRAYSFSESHLNSTGSHNIVGIDCSAGNMTYQLMSNDVEKGRIITIKKTDGGVGILTIATQGNETIDGVEMQSSTSAYASITVASNGVNWLIIDSYNW